MSEWDRPDAPRWTAVIRRARDGSLFRIRDATVWTVDDARAAGRPGSD